MLFVRANTVIILFSILFNPVFVASNILFAKENINLSFCGAEISTKDEEFLARGYCQKLSKHVALLKKFNEFNKNHKIIDFEIQDNIIFNIKNIEYKNEIIKACIAKMVEQKSLEPFFKTWDYVYSLCISNKDIEFVREFSIVIFSLYENLLMALISKKIFLEQKISNLGVQGEADEQGIKSLLDDIIQVYNIVSELPIKEIVVTLEKCYLLFSKILNDYGLGSGLSFRQWIKKYWWLPPTIILAIIGALLSNKISKK